MRSRDSRAPVLLAVEMHYVYYLIDVVTNDLLYIGRTNNPQTRIRAFEIRTGLKVRFGLHQRFRDFNRAAEAELAAIRKHRPPYNHRAISSRGMLGLLGRGTGPRGPMPQEHREAIQRTQTGKKKSPEHRQKISEALKGHPGHMLGRKHSEESRAKISAAKLLFWEKRRASA